MNQAPKYDNMTPSPARLAAIQAEADEHAALVKRSLQPALEANVDNQIRIASNPRSDVIAKRAAVEFLWKAGTYRARLFLKTYDHE
jgi:hypothetical protein